MSTEHESRFLAWLNDPEYPDPSPEDLERPEFEAVWRAIKGWDLSRSSDAGSTRLYAGASGNDVMHILNALTPHLTAAQTRESIRAYLQHVADVEVGTILSTSGREIVGFCASWVQNRLDEQWLKDKVVPIRPAEEVEADLTERTLSGLLKLEAQGRKDAEDTVEAIRADLEEERRYRDRAEAKLAAVRDVVTQYNHQRNEKFGSLTAMQMITDLLATSDVGDTHG